MINGTDGAGIGSRSSRVAQYTVNEVPVSIEVRFTSVDEILKDREDGGVAC